METERVELNLSDKAKDQLLAKHREAVLAKKSFDESVMLIVNQLCEGAVSKVNVDSLADGVLVVEVAKNG